MDSVVAHAAAEPDPAPLLERDGYGLYPAFIDGYMGHVPAQWQSAFGGPALTGMPFVGMIGKSKTASTPSRTPNPAGVSSVR
jgi:hypothetical protein